MLAIVLLLTFVGAPLPPLYEVNNVAVIIALLALVVQSFRQPEKTADSTRRGLFIFVAFALCNNILNV